MKGNAQILSELVAVFDSYIPKCYQDIEYSHCPGKMGVARFWVRGNGDLHCVSWGQMRKVCEGMEVVVVPQRGCI